MSRTLIFSFALATLAVGAPRLKDKGTDAPYFVLTEGTTLVYQAGDHEETQVVTKVESKDGHTTVHISTVHAGGRLNPNMVVKVSKDGVYLLEESGQKYDPPWLMLKTPVKTGEQWETKTTRPGLGTLESTHVVGKSEQLKLPAGTFTAVPVESTRNEGPGAGLGPIVHWYAPGIGWAKIALGGQTVKELKSVKLAGKK